MTIQQLVYWFKKDGLTLEEVKATVFAFLDNKGYVVNKNTHLVIEAHYKNFQEVA